MPSASDLTQSASELTNSAAVKAIPTATAGLGFNELFGWIETGVGLVAAIVGIMVSIALWRKIRLEHREIELRVKELERHEKEAYQEA